MDKTRVLIVVNPVLFIAACVQAATGLAFMLADSRLFYNIHRYNGIFLSVMIVVHLALNWGWVKSFVLSGRR
ncbi:MAG: DUF4405 domain-containing protein [Candidatus Omnitrophota bacterium]